MNTFKIADEKGYTQGAWKGKMYDSSLSISDIAMRVRHFAKKQYPNCKFSITTEKYSGGQSMSLRLMSAPFEVFRTPDIKKVPLSYYGGVEEGLKAWEHVVKKGSKDINQFHLKDDYQITYEARKVMEFLINATQAYNRDDSDAMIDYFSTNFYTHFGIGKWDKPFIKK